MKRVVGVGLVMAGKVWRRLLMYAYRPLFASYGDKFRFDPFGSYTYETIHVGNHVNLGMRPTLMAGRARIEIGDHVMFGPEVTIRGGCHRIDIAGRFMDCITDAEKRPEDDGGVVIGDDVWVGTRAVILHRVTIGRGAVVGAGAVVTRSVPPYSVVAGVPARILRLRWDVDTILAHEKRLYPPEKRLCRQDLERWQDGSNHPVGAGHGVR